jgi:3-oxoadipate enol-lactonase
VTLPLIFVHGVGSTAAIWEDQMREFSVERRCFAIELRGNGAHPDPSDVATITREGFADDVLACADDEGLDRFVIVGCSLGGVVAFELWRRARKRVAAMVIADSFAKYPEAQLHADGIKAAVLEAGNMKAFAHVRAAKLGLPPQRFKITVDQMACKSVEAYLASTQATWTGDYRRLLPTIDVPVLVCCGERDTVAPLTLSEEIAAAIPGAQLHVIPDAGHVSNADNPAAFNAILRDFLGRLEVDDAAG